MDSWVVSVQRCVNKFIKSVKWWWSSSFFSTEDATLPEAEMVGKISFFWESDPSPQDTRHPNSSRLLVDH